MCDHDVSWHSSHRPRGKAWLEPGRKFPGYYGIQLRGRTPVKRNAILPFLSFGSNCKFNLLWRSNPLCVTALLDIRTSYAKTADTIDDRYSSQPSIYIAHGFAQADAVFSCVQLCGHGGGNETSPLQSTEGQMLIVPIIFYSHEPQYPLFYSRQQS